MHSVLLLPWQWPCGAFHICDRFLGFFSLLSFLFILDEILLKYLCKSFSLYTSDLALVPSHFFTWDLFEMLAVLALYGSRRDIGVLGLGWVVAQLLELGFSFPARCTWGVLSLSMDVSWVPSVCSACTGWPSHAFTVSCAFPQEHSISLCLHSAFLWAVQTVSPGCCCH